MRKLSQIETCFEYFTRQLREGWRCISLSYPFALLASPKYNKITQLLNVDNNVGTSRYNTAGDITDIAAIGDTPNYECVDESVKEI